MSIGDSMKKLIGIEDLDDITDEEVAEAKEKMAKEQSRKPQAPVRSEHVVPEKRQPVQQPKPGERRFSMTSGTSAFKLVLIEPKTFEECPKLVDSLKARKPIIINLEKLETEVAKKIFDFLSGATYALNGNVQKVATNIFIFAPDNVDIAGGQMDDKATFEFGRDEAIDAAPAGTNSPWR